MLFFDRQTGREKPWSQDLWIYNLRTNQHFTLKPNPLSYEAPAVIAAEIAEDPEAALVQFAQIAATLSAEPDEI